MFFYHLKMWTILNLNICIVMFSNMFFNNENDVNDSWIVRDVAKKCTNYQNIMEIYECYSNVFPKLMYLPLVGARFEEMFGFSWFKKKYQQVSCWTEHKQQGISRWGGTQIRRVMIQKKILLLELKHAKSRRFLASAVSMILFQKPRFQNALMAPHL